MSEKFYRTPTTASTRVRCPVCHEPVYSRAGIHPQCAVRQSDPPRPKVKAKGPGEDGTPEAALEHAAACAVVPSAPE